MNNLIEDVSDTARWVAFYRAMETERNDALFHDPYAKELAGSRGEQIVRRMTGGRQSAWAVVVRTAVLDEILLRILAGGEIGCVLNLAAGLDTRPYRLDLPGRLRWIEVDRPALVSYKERSLATRQPRCQLERVSLDLADGRARADLLDRVEAAGLETLVLTEGLLVYLEAEQVAALSRDLAARTRLRQWLLDLAGPAVLGPMSRRGPQKELEVGNTPMRFAPDEGPDFSGPHGWRTVEVRYAWEEARLLGREPWWMGVIWRTSAPQRRQTYREIARYLLLEREVG